MLHTHTCQLSSYIDTKYVMTAQFFMSCLMKSTIQLIDLTVNGLFSLYGLFVLLTYTGSLRYGENV